MRRYLFEYLKQMEEYHERMDKIKSFNLKLEGF